MIKDVSVYDTCYKFEECLERLQKMSELVGKLAHDFNNILQILTGNIDILLLNCKNHKIIKVEDIEEYLQNIDNSIQHASTLIRQLINITILKDIKKESNESD